SDGRYLGFDVPPRVIVIDVVSGSDAVDLAVKAEVSAVGVIEDARHQKAVIERCIEDGALLLGSSGHIHDAESFVPRGGGFIADLFEGLAGGLGFEVGCGSILIDVGNADGHGDGLRLGALWPGEISAGASIYGILSCLPAVGYQFCGRSVAEAGPCSVTREWMAEVHDEVDLVRPVAVAEGQVGDVALDGMVADDLNRRANRLVECAADGNQQVWLLICGEGQLRFAGAVGGS